MPPILADLPGHEIVEEGLIDLAAGRESESSLLVAMAAPRLRSLGFEVPASGGAQPVPVAFRRKVEAALS
jgi:hypothetical protein